MCPVLVSMNLNTPHLDKLKMKRAFLWQLYLKQTLYVQDVPQKPSAIHLTTNKQVCSATVANTMNTI